MNLEKTNQEERVIMTDEEIPKKEKIKVIELEFDHPRVQKAFKRAFKKYDEYLDSKEK
jgi:hypothetical protein